uniref:EXS domain-containing protein n=1 Tax=Parascaris univalens TaxID=6257 RepID=A0A915AMT4_PARUN
MAFRLSSHYLAFFFCRMRHIIFDQSTYEWIITLTTLVTLISYMDYYAYRLLKFDAYSTYYLKNKEFYGFMNDVTFELRW